MDRLIKIEKMDEIPEKYRNTPISELIAYHNFFEPHKIYSSAQILVGMCMDNRKQLKIPENFAYIIRTGGANLRHSEFKVSFAISVGKVRYVALIGHNNCGMVNLTAKKETFIDGLVDAGWDAEYASQHFYHFAPLFEIGNEIDFTQSEVIRMRSRYPKVTFVPMIYNVDDNKLYFIREN